MADEVFDREKLLARVDGDIPLLAEVFEDFVDDVAERMAFARRAVECDDATALQEQAHALKGCLSALAAVRAWELANLLERRACGETERDEEAEGAPASLLDTLDAEFEILFEQIRDLIADLS